MRRQSMIVSLAFCLIVSAALCEVNAKKPTTTITGKIKAAETYRGKARSVYIEVDGGDAFLVARGTDMGKELCKRVGTTVTATGYVSESKRNLEFDTVLDVLSYEIDGADKLAAERP